MSPVFLALRSYTIILHSTLVPPSTFLFLSTFSFPPSYMHRSFPSYASFPFVTFPIFFDLTFISHFPLLFYFYFIPLFMGLHFHVYPLSLSCIAFFHLSLTTHPIFLYYSSSSSSHFLLLSLLWFHSSFISLPFHCHLIFLSFIQFFRLSFTTFFHFSFLHFRLLFSPLSRLSFY